MIEALGLALLLDRIADHTLIRRAVKGIKHVGPHRIPAFRAAVYFATGDHWHRQYGAAIRTSNHYATLERSATIGRRWLCLMVIGRDDTVTVA